MPEGVRVEGVTTLQGRVQDGAHFPFEAIQDANDAVMTIVSRNTNGDPTRIEWTSEKASTKWKAVQVLVYDVSNRLVTTTNSIQAR